MRFIGLFILFNCTSILCILIAGMAMLDGKSGWAWGCFLAVGFVTHHSMKVTQESEE